MKNTKSDIVASNIQQAEVTYKVKVALLPGVLVPDKPRVCADWLPTRHGILLNEYMRWIRQHKGSKQEFAKNLVEEIENGQHPLLEKTAFDSKPFKPITYHSIMSQLDWFAQKENQVIMEEENSTFKLFCPNNLMILTTKQKAEESRRSKAKRDSQLCSEDSLEDSEDFEDFEESEASEDLVTVKLPRELALQISQYL